MGSRICSRCGFLNSPHLSVPLAKIWTDGLVPNIRHVQIAIVGMRMLITFSTAKMPAGTAYSDLRQTSWPHG
jgi:hypothetical protein